MTDRNGNTVLWWIATALVTALVIGMVWLAWLVV